MTEQDQPDFTVDRIKHLDMIQGVVSRMAGNSTAIKRYCLIIVAVGVAIYKTIDDPFAVVALAVMVCVFWLLDSKYLQQEKWFRDIYDQVRTEPAGQRPDFRLTPDKTVRGSTWFWGRVFSWSTAGLYVPLLALLALFWFVMTTDDSVCTALGSPAATTGE